MCIVPALRFPEFSGEWKSVHLEEIAEFQKQRISTALLNNNNYISTENILQDFEGIQYSSSIPTNTNVIEYQKGDILLSNIRPYLKKVWFSDRKGGCSADVFVLRGDKCDQHFLYYVIASDRFINYVMSGVKGVKMPRGDKSQMEKYAFSIPTNTEQRKIAKFLSMLDERIRLQNKIIEDLKKLMSAISLLLFSECFANDKLVPLKSISNSIKRKNDGQIHPIMMISAEHGFINQSEKYDKDNAGNSLSNYTLLYKGELSYNRGSSKSKKFGSVFSLLIQSALVPHVYHSFCMDESVADCTFYSLLLNSRLLDKELVKVVSSTARMDGLLNISKEDFFSIKVPLPCIDKQRSITNILQKINIKIKREKNIQSLLCLQRKYLLSQMFI